MNLPLTALLLLVWPIWAQVQGTGVIEVRLQNATPGGAIAGAAVTLASMTEAGWQTERSAAADEQGKVTFTDLPRGSGTMYLPIVAYGGAWYYPPQPLDLSAESRGSVDITVYDATRSDQALRYDRAAMLVAGIQPDALAIMEMSALNNTEPRTFVGADGGDNSRAITARFPLPSGALGVQPQTGLVASQVTTTADGFAMTWPLPPGRHELAFSYQLPYSGNEVVIDRVLAYPVNALTVYLPETNLQLASDRLADQGVTELGGQRYRVYTASNLDRGERLKLQITGLDGTPAPSGAPNTSMVVLGSGAATLLGGLALAFVWRRRAAEGSPVASASRVGPDKGERARLIGEIAVLDEQFAAGLLTEADHREARDELLERVGALTPPSVPVVSSESPAS